ncbi:MAG TPA: c-type cytochrome [Burkholderiales bacterium]|nr:c-type cytochrome [Burkholderiales bacterium]
MTYLFTSADEPGFLSKLFGKRWVRWLFILLAVPTFLALAAGLYAWHRFGGDKAVVYDDIEEHFKYGSTGGEHTSGFPYWIFQALPQVCSEHLPGKGYASLGLIYEDGKDLPIGMSKRHFTGIDRTFLNCSVCHASTVRETPQQKPKVYLGMPAMQLDIMGFEKFFFSCAADPKFASEFIVPEARRLVQAQGGDLDLIDRYVVYPVAVALMRERLLMLAGRFSFVMNQPDWGPGRVDTFNSAKVIFNFPMHKIADAEKNAPADFPSIWLQGPRQGMQLHWDGNNTKVEERNKSAAFGTGTTPPTLDTQAIGRIEKWLTTKEPPKYPFAIDGDKAQRGAEIYKEHCAECHGASGRNFAGKSVGKVTTWADIGTDRRRLDSYTYDLAVNQSTLYAGYPWRFQHFRKTNGYANMPLDGIWLRAPYLHNGSVPTLRDLLEPAARRPKVFYRGYDVYDAAKVGFKSNVAEEGDRKYFRFDTEVAGNGNWGHEGRRFGTGMSIDDKESLVEFLKTF